MPNRTREVVNVRGNQEKSVIPVAIFNEIFCSTKNLKMPILLRLLIFVRVFTDGRMVKRFLISTAQHYPFLSARERYDSLRFVFPGSKPDDNLATEIALLAPGLSIKDRKKLAGFDRTVRRHKQLAGYFAYRAPNLTAQEREELRLESFDPDHSAGMIATYAHNLTASEREEFLLKASGKKRWAEMIAVYSSGLTVAERVKFALQSSEPDMTVARIADESKLTDEESRELRRTYRSLTGKNLPSLERKR